jgi:hypothetical protein
MTVIRKKTGTTRLPDRAVDRAQRLELESIVELSRALGGGWTA